MQPPKSLTLPLEYREDGSITITGTQVSLYDILVYYKAGDSPEVLRETFPNIPLSVIHVIIAYYLENKRDVDAYLAKEQAKIDAVGEQIVANYSDKQKERAQYLKALYEKKKSSR